MVHLLEKAKVFKSLFDYVSKISAHKKKIYKIWMAVDMIQELFDISYEVIVTIIKTPFYHVQSLLVIWILFFRIELLVNVYSQFN